jgi:Cft2 family RNA processing exonuclease
MFITDLCRNREIGANSLLVEIGPYRILIDAGLHPKHVGYPATPDFSKIPRGGLDFIFLTHCHLDHVGSLPVIAERHPEAIVLASIPSQMIIGRILANSHSVMKRQKEELQVAEYPLFGLKSIDTLQSRMIGMPYAKPRIFNHKKPPIEITFYQSGHVAGAAGISIKCNYESLFLSGDVLFDHQLTLGGAQFPSEHHEVLVLETTRGATERHPSRSRQSETQRLIDVIGETLDGGGSCLIPAFAFGRMQEMVSLLHEAYRHKMLPRAPIFCSGLGMALMEYFDLISRKTQLVRFRTKMMRELGIKRLAQEITPGRSPKRPSIFLVSSGMLVDKTPSYAVAASLLNDPKNSICFVGYCDPDTPGGQLQNTNPGEPFSFNELNYTTPLRAFVERFDLSGHADRDQLVDFAQHMDPRAVILTHGEAEARDWFIDTLTESMPSSQIIDPVPGKRFSI